MKQNINQKPLTAWLDEAAELQPFKDSILNHMKILGYKDEELLDIYQALATHGRLFLNSLLRACTTVNIPDAIKKLQPLANELKIIEATLPPPAHFIWVGPPTTNTGELSGVRSLNAAKGGQKINFWVLDEHVEHYRKLAAELSLSNVEMVSIEAYAKKTGYTFEDGETLIAQIDHFKNLADKNACKSKEARGKAEALKNEETETWLTQSKLLMTDAIRDRVTIVDHVKLLIPLFEGGHICDVDLIFALPFDDSRQATLPELAKWTFPCLKKRTSDVWYVYSLKGLTWSGSDQSYKEDEYTDSDLRNNRNKYLKTYNTLVRSIYRERGKDSLNSDFTDALCRAICGISRFFKPDAFRYWTMDADYANKMFQLNDYPLVDLPHLWWLQRDDYDSEPSCKSQYGLDTEYQYDSRICNLTLPDGTSLVKYYTKSHRPDKNSKSVEPPIHIELLTLKNPQIFEKVLHQKIQFSALDITVRFSTNIKKTTDDFEAAKKFYLNQITILHLSLFARPDLFSAILNEVPLGQMEELLTMEVPIPKEVFSKDDQQASQETEAYTLEKLLEKLKDTNPYNQKNRSNPLNELLEAAKNEIQDAQIAVRIFKEIPLPDRQYLAAKNNPSKIIQSIIDIANSRTPHDNFFTSTNDTYSQALSNLGVKKCNIAGAYEFTITEIRDTVVAKIIQEKTAAQTRSSH